MSRACPAMSFMAGSRSLRRPPRRCRCCSACARSWPGRWRRTMCANAAQRTRQFKQRQFNTRATLDLRWVANAQGVIDALRRLTLPPGDGFAWCAGEAKAVAAQRRVLVEELGIGKHAVRAAAGILRPGLCPVAGLCRQPAQPEPGELCQRRRVRRWHRAADGPHQRHAGPGLDGQPAGVDQGLALSLTPRLQSRRRRLAELAHVELAQLEPTCALRGVGAQAGQKKGRPKPPPLLPADQAVGFRTNT